MVIMGMKYGCSTHFHTEHTFIAKTEGVPLCFKPKHDIFQNLKTIVYINVISNQATIWT
jgi:hypothetical protein